MGFFERLKDGLQKTRKIPIPITNEYISSLTHSIFLHFIFIILPAPFLVAVSQLQK